MNRGTVVRARTLRHYYEPPAGVIWTDHTASKDHVFVLVLLGEEPKDGSAPLDVNAVMEDMGWTGGDTITVEGIA